jgi:hypothetical protein
MPLTAAVACGTVCPVCPADAISLVRFRCGRETPAVDGLAAGVLRQTGYPRHLVDAVSFQGKLPM